MAATFPGGVKSFTTKVDGVTTVVAEHVNSLQDEVAAIETGLLTWQDWTPDQTGWVSISGEFKYARVGNLVFWKVRDLTGVSNSAKATISLPISTSDPTLHFGIFVGHANSGGYILTFGYWKTDGSDINFFPGDKTTSWATSGTKSIPGASGFYVIEAAL